MAKACRLVCAAALMLALAAPLQAAAAESSEGTIPPGTVINMQNWQQYRKYMTYSMEVLFEGKYIWKFPPDFQLTVGPPKHYPMGSKPYIEATSKYAGQVKIESLPNGGHNITGYVAGMPFPNPSGPLKGWQILVDDWFAYQPYLLCIGPIGQYHFVDRFHHVTTETFLFMERRVGHIADDKQPLYEPNAPGEDFVSMGQILSPEQARYTAVLTVYYLDLSKPEDTFLFIPALRRSLRLSSAARCSPLFGSDVTYDDARHGAFNGNITRFDATYLGDKPVLMMPEYDAAGAQQVENFYTPLFFPRPNLGKWQVRNSWVLDVHRIPSQRQGYCYGKRVLYVDKDVYQSQWADLYDENGKFWKVDFDPQDLTPVPGQGAYWTNNGVGGFWDVQNSHLSSVMLPTSANDNCRNVGGEDFTDLGRWGSVTGLSQIMR